MDKIFKADFTTREIFDQSQILDKTQISHQIREAYSDNENLTNYIFMNNEQQQYTFFLVKTDNQFEFFKIIQVSDTKFKKGKYAKVEIKHKAIRRAIDDIGFVNAQQLHANDLHQYDYIPLRKFLKQNPNTFKKTYIYEKGFNDQFQILRHKNLFSKYHDELSDFERLTTIERYEPKTLKLSYEIDEDVHDFDGTSVTNQERKFLREFAKDIYTKKNQYTERELFEILSGRDLYIQIVTTIPKEHKDVWSKVSIDQMDIRILEKSRDLFNNNNIPTDKKRKYLSKRQKNRKLRAIEKQENIRLVNEYYQFET